jgi:hypothetical protein
VEDSVQGFLLSGQMQLPSSSSNNNSSDKRPASENCHSDHLVEPRSSEELQDNFVPGSPSVVIPEEDSTRVAIDRKEWNKPFA